MSRLMSAAGSLQAWLGRAIRERRESLAVSRMELGRRAHVSRSQLIDIENGLVTARIDTLERIATALGLELVLTDAKSVARREPPRLVRVGNFLDLSGKCTPGSHVTPDPACQGPARDS